VFGGTDFSAGVDLANIQQGVGGFVVFADSAGDAFGGAVSSAGDINGDGFDDLVVGAQTDLQTQFGDGAGYVLFGRDFSGAVTHQGTDGDDTLTGDATSNVLIGGLGDDILDGGGGFDALNGGGGDDVLVFEAIGGQRFDGGLGFDTLRVDGAGVSFNLTSINDNLGHYTLYRGIDAIDVTGTGGNSLTLDLHDLLALAEDANSLRVDGDADDAVDAGGGWTQHANTTVGATTYAVYTQGGATLQVALASDRSEVKVGTFDAAGIADLGGFKIVGETVADLAGMAVAMIGDHNGDGFDDIAIGAYLNDGGGLNAGATYIVFGKANGFGTIDLDAIAAGTGGYKLAGDAAGDYAGRSVSSAGDINGDGFADLIVGADGHDTGGLNAGAAYVVFGKASDFDGDGFKLVGESATDFAGHAVALAGDVNGDGLNDVILGAYQNDGAGANSGAAYVALGGTTLIGSISLADIAAGSGGNGGFKLVGENANDQVGFDVAGAGDFNGDGFDEVLVSTFRDSTGGSFAGAT
jgi:hypothetical protein